MTEIGHNSSIAGTARDQLRAFVERIERLEEEKAALAADIREVYAEAKSMGFDVKTLRTIVKLRKQDVNERQEQEAILATYMIALGMLADTPLGEAAIERDVGAGLQGRIHGALTDAGYKHEGGNTYSAPAASGDAE